MERRCRTPIPSSSWEVGGSPQALDSVELYLPTADASWISGVMIALALGGGRDAVSLPPRSKPIRRGGKLCRLYSGIASFELPLHVSLAHEVHANYRPHIRLINLFYLLTKALKGIHGERCSPLMIP